MKTNLKSMLKISMLTLTFCGLMVSTINAQTKPAQKPVKKDSVKKEVAAKGTKDAKKAPVAPSAQPVKKH